MVGVILGMIILIYLMVRNYVDLEIAKNHVSDDIFRLDAMMGLWAFLFGILLEWRGLGKIIGRKFRINWILLILTVILSVFVFIPSPDWVLWYGTEGGTLRFLFIKMLEYPETHTILSVLVGTLLVRAFTDNK